MKRVFKALIIAGAMLLAGIILSSFSISIAMKRNGKTHHTTQAENKNRTEQTYLAEGADINKLTIDIKSEDIQVEPADGTEIELIYYDDASNPDYRVVENGDYLRLERKSANFHISNIVEIEELLSFQDVDSNQTYSIIVRIPECYMGDYNLSSVSGNITMEDVPAEQSIRMDSTSGILKIAGIDCQGSIHMSSTSGGVDITDSSAVDGITSNSTSGDVHLTNVESQAGVSISATSGRLSFDTVEIDGPMDLEGTSGDADMENLTVSGVLRFDSTSGGIKGNHVTIGELYTDTTSGDIMIQELTLGTGMHGSSTSGTFSISLTDSMDDYAIHTDTISGYVTLPNDYHPDLSRYISISTTSGDIEFEFAE